MRMRQVAQLLAYAIVVVLAAFAVFRVQALSDSQVHQIRASQRQGCERTNDRIQDQNAKFGQVYALVGTIGDTLPPSPIKRALDKAEREYVPLALTDCIKAYPDVTK